MRPLIISALLVACAPPSQQTVTLRPPTASPSVPTKWGELAYHLELGLWELTGQLHDGRGTFELAYHDGSTGPIEMVLESVKSCELRDRRSIVAVHLVSAEPSRGIGRQWYGLYTGTPPTLLGAVPTGDDLTCDHGDVFLITGACRCELTITNTIKIAREWICQKPGD